MRTALLAATAALSLLAGCREASDQPAANDAAVQNAPVLPITDEQVAGALAPAPASKEAALKLMHERHEGMEDIGDAFKVLGREMKSDAPDLESVRTHAATVARLAPAVTRWIPAGTRPDVGQTRAEPATRAQP